MDAILAKSLALPCFSAGAAEAADLPREIATQLPPGYGVLASTRAAVEVGHLSMSWRSPPRANARDPQPRRIVRQRGRCSSSKGAPMAAMGS
jgi:hypothetical protein